MLASGVALGLHFATWIASLSYTSVAASVLLVNTAPLFTLAFSRLVLGEAVAARGGGRPWRWRSPGPPSSPPATGRESATSLLGDPASPWRARSRCPRTTSSDAACATRCPLPAYVLGVWAGGGGDPGRPGRRGAASPSPGTRRARSRWLLALAVVPTVLGHGLVNRSLRAFPAPTVGLFLLGEPVAASALAYAVFGERPGALTLAGGVLVMAALALVVRSEAA